MDRDDIARVRAWYETCKAHQPTSPPCAYSGDPKKTDCDQCHILLGVLEREAYGSS